MLKYLSPSSIRTYMEDPEDFYAKYMATDRAVRFAQTPPMAVGSGFDALVKCALSTDLTGSLDMLGVDSIRQLWEDQVSSEFWEADDDRDLWVDSFLAFNSYKDCGAYAQILEEMARSVKEFGIGSIGFESTLQGELAGVPFLGKPDAHWKCMVDDVPVQVIHDWKVNGFYSSMSPYKYYYKVLPAGTPHKLFKGLAGLDPPVSDTPLHMVKNIWAEQEAVYGWLLGVPVGGMILGSFHQIVRSRAGVFRTGCFRHFIDPSWQQAYFSAACDLWSMVQKHISGSVLLFDDDMLSAQNRVAGEMSL